MTGGAGSGPIAEPVGTFCLVLHSHLPWLAGHGTWPVGEEWLHQAWSQSYGPVFDVLLDLADAGHRNIVTLGMTPVLATQLDDPYCVAEHHTWLSNWQQRAIELAQQPSRDLRNLGRYEYRSATEALERHEQRWLRGASTMLRRLADSGAIEILGGPATHPFQPLLPERVAEFSLRVGMDDHVLRFGSRPHGIWAPECAYRPGLEALYDRQGVNHFMVDGPTLQHVGASTATGWRIAESDVVAFGRDLEVSYRVWSPKSGYPGGRWYRDFHTYHHESGFKPARVTSRSTPPEDKSPYDPERARSAVAGDVADFVRVVRRRLADIQQRDGKPGLVVAAYDTELFGHWWHEGPQWLAGIASALPEAGIRMTTLQGALDAGLVSGSVSPEAGSWGLRKDFHVWDSAETADVVALNRSVSEEIVSAVEGIDAAAPDPTMDDAAREALLALQSDWAFMISHRSAVDYARSRALGHAARMRDLLRDGTRSGTAPSGDEPTGLSRRPHRPGSPFGHLDARLL